MTYDAFGNIVTKKKDRSDQRFEYDAENRLMAVHTTSPRETITTRFSYDAMDRRIGKTVWDARRIDPTTGQMIEQETRFLWQGLHMVQERSNDVLRTYLYEPGSYTPLACHDQPMQVSGRLGKGHAYYFHTDHIGTPLEVTGPGGALVWSGHYSAWGKLLRNDILPGSQTPAFAQNLRYQGQYADESTGLHYSTFRYYDPDIARFTTQDPIGLEGGMNL